jgi:hypothetical protein
VIVINASNNGNSGNLCQRVEATLPTLNSLLLTNGFNFLSYDTKTILNAFNYKGGIYPDIIGNLHWLPIFFETTTEVWSDIQNGIDRRSELNVMNGRFNGNIFLNMNTYSAREDLKNNYVDPTNSNAVLNWAMQF